MAEDGGEELAADGLPAAPGSAAVGRGEPIATASTGARPEPDLPEDVAEQADELLVLADVPGAKSEAIDVDFEDGMLEIRAPVAIPECKNGTCLSHEYGIGDYYRSFRVTEAIDATKISAEYADGVLTLHLPKAEAIKPRKIAVSAK